MGGGVETLPFPVPLFAFRSTPFRPTNRHRLRSHHRCRQRATGGIGHNFCERRQQRRQLRRGGQLRHSGAGRAAPHPWFPARGVQGSSADVLPLEPGARFALDVALAPIQSNLEVVVRDRRLDDAGMVREKNGWRNSNSCPAPPATSKACCPTLPSAPTWVRAANLPPSTRCAAATTTKTSCTSMILKFTAPNSCAPASRRALRSRTLTSCATCRFRPAAFRPNTATKCRRYWTSSTNAPTVCAPAPAPACSAPRHTWKAA
jgi:hypothetical protein